MKVALLFGGESSEHEVSLQSAFNVYREIDKEKFDVLPVGVSKNGAWMYFGDGGFLKNENDPSKIQLDEAAGHVFYERRNSSTSDFSIFSDVDAVFSVIHGTTGEDGSLQGFFKILGIPMVGPNTLSSSICMDKDIAKVLLQVEGIKVANWFVMRKGDPALKFERVVSNLGLPLFIKPAREGSSVGVSKVETKEEYEKALELAFEKDDKVLIEQGIEGREIEVAVLGNEQPIASLPGEVLSDDGFYSYEEKYITSDGSETKIPADLNAAEVTYVQKLAIKTYKALECSGMARVDFFLNEEGEWLVNEVNTIPGFTKISMYPKLWGETGIPYTDLITKLIELSLNKKR